MNEATTKVNMRGWPVKDRLMYSVEVDANGCWLRNTGRATGGYTKLKLPGSRVGASAHRVSYELFKGPIPDGLLVCHKCDVRNCINPDHLFVGTYLDNMRDCVAKGRFARGDRSGARLHRERWPRGDNNPSRRMPERLMRGEEVNTAKMTADLVRQMRADFKEGNGNYFSLAKKYGVTRAMSRRIILKIAWKHVE